MQDGVLKFFFNSVDINKEDIPDLTELVDEREKAHAYLGSLVKRLEPKSKKSKSKQALMSPSPVDVTLGEIVEKFEWLREIFAGQSKITLLFSVAENAAKDVVCVGTTPDSSLESLKSLRKRVGAIRSSITALIKRSSDE